MHKPATVLFAPDSFKGSLTSVEVARALAAGWARARPDDTILLSPLGDGGEGTIEAIAAAGGWTPMTTTVQGPDFVELEAGWLRSTDGSRAFVEMARSSGLSLLAPEDRQPTLLTTFGTGQVLADVLDHGIRKITLGIGGSATNDGGSGLLQAMGVRPLDDTGKTPVEEPTAVVPAQLFAVVTVDLSGLDDRLRETELEVACDVDNPLLGPNGATAIYGPQKGVTSDNQAFLEDGLAAFADALEAATGRRERDTPGAGAAGGVGFALLAIQEHFRSFALRPGVDLVMEATNFDQKLARASLVITGEGRIDAQTGFGKTALGVAKRAQAARVPCIAVGGGVEPDGIDALAAVGAIAVPVTERPQTVEEAMAAGADPLERCSERLALLISMID